VIWLEYINDLSLMEIRVVHHFVKMIQGNIKFRPNNMSFPVEGWEIESLEDVIAENYQTLRLSPIMSRFKKDVFGTTTKRKLECFSLHDRYFARIEVCRDTTGLGDAISVDSYFTLEVEHTQNTSFELEMTFSEIGVKKGRMESGWMCEEIPLPILEIILLAEMEVKEAKDMEERTDMWDNIELIIDIEMEENE